MEGIDLLRTMISITPPLQTQSKWSLLYDWKINEPETKGLVEESGLTGQISASHSNLASMKEPNVAKDCSVKAKLLYF